VVSQIVAKNIFKVFYNIGHIIYYKAYNSILYLIDIELLSQFNTISLMKSPNQIDKNDDLVNDYIDSWYEDEHRPYCETP